MKGYCPEIEGIFNEETGDVPISVVLSILVNKKNRVIANLIFRNKTDQTQYLDPNRALFRGITNKHFWIRCEDKEVEYIGELALKSAAPTPEEYIPIPPFGSVTREVDITDVYDFFQGIHVYEAVYFEYHGHPYKAVLYPLKSNISPFVYSKNERDLKDK